MAGRWEEQPSQGGQETKRQNLMLRMGSSPQSCVHCSAEYMNFVHARKAFCHRTIAPALLPSLYSSPYLRWPPQTQINSYLHSGSFFF